MFNPLLLLGAAAAFLFFNQKKTYGFETVQGKTSGHQWLTRVVSITGSGDDKKTVVEVWAPAGSWGPMQQTLVATYEQTGSDMASRRMLSTGPSAVPQMVTAAGQDFGIKQPAVSTSVSGDALIAGFRPDVSYPIFNPKTKHRIGKVDIFHSGDQWRWIASFRNGRPIARGTGLTPRQAHSSATRTALRRLESDKRKLLLSRHLP